MFVRDPTGRKLSSSSARLICAEVEEGFLLGLVVGMEGWSWTNQV